MQCVILVTIAVQFISHDDRPVSFKSICSRFQIALSFKKTIWNILISDTEVVQNCLLLALLNYEKCWCKVFFSGFRLAILNWGVGFAWLRDSLYHFSWTLVVTIAFRVICTSRLPWGFLLCAYGNWLIISRWNHLWEEWWFDCIDIAYFFIFRIESDSDSLAWSHWWKIRRLLYIFKLAFWSVYGETWWSSYWRQALFILLLGRWSLI